MTDRIDTFRTQHVTYMPDAFGPGVLYVSAEYGCTIHLCACGCGEKTVCNTQPVWRDGWTLAIDAEDRATLNPSIGSFQIPCRSHYWIRDGKVVWA